MRRAERFRNDVRPILENFCFDCHADGVRKGNVELDNFKNDADLLNDREFWFKVRNLRQRCPDMDQASAALISDLKRRGLLDETVVVWGGEFGRTPVSESGDGRDHNPYGFTMFMAGGGFKGGMSYGQTDEFGFRAVEDRMSIHDLHATLLYVLGIDHEKLTYRYAGRDFRLTDVYGQVMHDLLT
jgi:hypothetical protein